MVSQPEGYVIDQAVSFDQAFLETAFSLEEGEYDLTLGSSGYHIIKRFPLREEDLDSTYFDVYGTGATVRDVLFMKKPKIRSWKRSTPTKRPMRSSSTKRSSRC